MKAIYNMIDGIPIWQHLKNGDGAWRSGMKLIARDYGKIAEILGKRALDKLSEKGGILDKIFPGINIISVHKHPRIRLLDGRKVELGDLTLEIDYKYGNKFGKKVVVFEIKHGKFQIDQNQIRRYSFMIHNPEKYFPKADELKVIFMMFDRIDTVNCYSSYSMSELNKDLAKKIIESIPVEEWHKYEIKGEYYDVDNNIEYGMSKLFQ